MTHQTNADPLALASETPNVSALIEEFTRAVQDGPAARNQLANGEAVLYQWRSGKSNPPDGRLWQKNQPQGVTVRPYDKIPDVDDGLPEELTQFEIDVALFAFQKAQVGARSTHLTAFTAGQIAEAKAMLRWIRDCTAPEMEDGAELLAYVMKVGGWSCLCSGWREKWGLVERRVTMEEVFQAANAAFQAWQQEQARPASRDQLSVSSQPPPLVQLPQLIADPTTEDLATTIVGEFLPHLKRAAVKTLVRELRTDGEATFRDRQLEYQGPCLKVRIPGVDIFNAGGDSTGQNARGWLEVDFYYEAELRAMALDAEWNEDFIEAAVQTGGLVSTANKQTQTPTWQDSQERRIEIWTAKVRQFDADLGTTGVYCTVFSPHLTPAPAHLTPRSYYATHYLQKAAHGQYPVDICRREVTGPRIEDARGVPETVQADSNQLRLHKNVLAMSSEWRGNPTQVQLGNWSKIAEPVRPGSVLTPAPGGELKSFAPESDANGTANFVDRLERNARRRFAVPNNGQDGDHPSLWMLRQSRQAARFLHAPARAYLKLMIMAYQELTPQQIAQIIGRPPLLTVPDLLRCQISLSFEVRSLDTDWTTQALDTFIKLLSVDTGGLMDHGPIIRAIGSMTDTTLMDEVLRTPEGAKAQLYRKVQQDITSIMLGNPAPMVEMDPTAGTQLQLAMQVLKQNPKYQQALQQDPQVQENLKTYVQNLQHSQQETQISPVQGRTGVAAMPAGPVSKGSALATAGANY